MRVFAAAEKGLSRLSDALKDAAADAMTTLRVRLRDLRAGSFNPVTSALSKTDVGKRGVYNIYFEKFGLSKT